MSNAGTADRSLRGMAHAASRRRQDGSDGRDRGTPAMFELLPPAALLVVALLFGGSANPLGDMVIDCLAVLLLALLAIRFDGAAWRRSRLGWLMVGMAAIVAAIELVPLPYSLWRALPGRAAPAEMLGALALSGGARSLSLDPNATVATIIQVIPGLAMFVAALAASGRTRRLLTAIVIGGSILCVILGTLQMTGNRAFYLYEQSNFGDVTGLFANHNHAADLLLIGIALLAERYRETAPGRSGGRIILGALIATLAVTVVLTASRFGIVLLVAEAIALMLYSGGIADRRRWLPLALVVVAGAVVVAVLLSSNSVTHALNRFNSFSGDLRAEFWTRTIAESLGFWPVGSGLGTFVPIYASVERLDTLPREIVNHAHNEYLELFLELGIVAVVLIVGYLTALTARIATAVRGGSGRIIFAPAVGIMVLLIHSFVEFPLRNESLMVTFGLLNGLVFAAVRRTSLNKA